MRSLGTMATGVRPASAARPRRAVGERLGAGVGEHQPRRGRRLGRREAFGELEPVQGQLVAGHGQDGPDRRLGQAVSGQARGDDAAFVEQQPAAGRARLVDEDESAFRWQASAGDVCILARAAFAAVGAP